MKCDKHGYDHPYTQCPACTKFKYVGCTPSEEIAMNKMIEYMEDKIERLESLVKYYEDKD